MFYITALQNAIPHCLENPLMTKFQGPIVYFPSLQQPITKCPGRRQCLPSFAIQSCRKLSCQSLALDIHFTLIGKNIDKPKANWRQAQLLRSQKSSLCWSQSSFPPHYLHLSLHLNTTNNWYSNGSLINGNLASSSAYKFRKAWNVV